MVRGRPVKITNVIGQLNVNPENAIGDYVEAKQQAELSFTKPNWDTAGESIELLFINNGFENANMMRLHNEVLENSKQQNASNTERTRRLYKQHNELRRRFIDVNFFIKDCIEKKQVADKKVFEETIKHKEFNESVNNNRDVIEKLKQFRETLKGTVNELESYEHVLNDVVGTSDLFLSIKDLMDRCDGLMMAQLEIQLMRDSKFSNIKEMHDHMKELTKAAALKVLGLKNTLTELERSYNAACHQCTKWEKILSATQSAIAEKYLDKVRVLDALYQMYLLLCKRRGCSMESMWTRADVERQLNFIKYEVELLKEVYKEFQRNK